MNDVARTIRDSKKKIHQTMKDRKTQESDPGESTRKTPAGKRLEELRRRKARRS